MKHSIFNRFKILNTSLFLAAAISCAPSLALGQSKPPVKTPSKAPVAKSMPDAVAVTFGNDTGKDLLIASAKGGLVNGKPTKLSDQKQISCKKTFPGQTWLVLDPSQSDSTGKGPNPIAIYTVDSALNQSVSLKSLIAYQTPCETIFVNDLTATDEESYLLDILWLKPDGTEESYCQQLEPGKQFSNNDTLPGHTWRVRNHGKLIGEYVVRAVDLTDDGQPLSQVISLNDLSNHYASQVSLTFVNQTNTPISIYWSKDDSQEVLYAPNMPPGKAYIQQGQPGHTWQIKSGTKTLLKYTANDKKNQVITVPASKPAAIKPSPKPKN